MKYRKLILLSLILLVVSFLFILFQVERGVFARTYSLDGGLEITSSTPLTNSFSYQGYLEHNFMPVDGIYHFTFELFDSEFGGDSVGFYEVEDAEVVDGRFTTTLEYDPGTFDGEERWLEIGFEDTGGGGGYFVLPDRQPITAVPYALYAVEGGYVPWTNVGNRPEGLDDGDDDTRYYAGYGVDLDDTTFNTMTDTIQVRVTDACEVGSTIISFNADGTVECEQHDNRPVFNQISLDTDGLAGASTSITIGADGLPVISYPKEIGGNGFIVVAHCNDIACTDASMNPIDSELNGSRYAPSIAIGMDGFPIISYLDTGNLVLKAAHCEDVACEGYSINVIDTITETGYTTSITIGSDGLPIMSYCDSNQDLKVAHCDDIACASFRTYIVDAVGNVGAWSSITIGGDAVPVISYHNTTNGNLKVAHCNDTSCSDADVTNVDTTGVAGWSTSITIGKDGMPIISYMDVLMPQLFFFTRGYLIVAHCNDLTCSQKDINVVDSSTIVGYFSSITIGMDGFPVISYHDYSNGNLKVAHCGDNACSSASTYAVDSSLESVGFFTSITIGVDGLPIISYFDSTYEDLKVTHCSNVFCIPYWQRR